MTTGQLKLDGHAPRGWSVSVDEARRGETYLSLTRDGDVGQIVPEITVSVLGVPDAGMSLEAVAGERRRAVAEAHKGVRLRRGEFISERTPEIYGQEIWFEAETSAADRIAVIQSEILFTFTEFRPNAISFLLTAPEPLFDVCLPDFKELFDSITAQESE